MGFPYQSDSLRRARNVCEGICGRMILHFSYYCKYGVLVFGDDGTGSADESKKTKRVQSNIRPTCGRLCSIYTLFIFDEQSLFNILYAQEHFQVYYYHLTIVGCDICMYCTYICYHKVGLSDYL